MTSQGSVDLTPMAREHLGVLCSVTPDRRPGSSGNDEATDYVGAMLAGAGWTVNLQSFDCLDWEAEGGEITIGETRVDLVPSPYGLGVSASGLLRVLNSEEDLARSDLAHSIVVLTGELAARPLTPMAYPFYRSEEDAAVVAALEAVQPLAVVAVTGRYPPLCGALDPFPLIEDGDFNVPAANLRPAEAAPLLDGDGTLATIEIRARRWPARARNVLAIRGPETNRVTVMAHIDSKPGTPGAVDNATGVVVLLLLAELLAPSRHPQLPVGVELLAVNGEDHYAAPGEVTWLAAQDDSLDDIALAINIDGAGFRHGGTAYSTYNLDDELAAHVDAVLADEPDLAAGPEWYQSDHAIFAMRGRPAVAITSAHLKQMLESIYHSPYDVPANVDINVPIGVACALEKLIANWPTGRMYRQA